MEDIGIAQDMVQEVFIKVYIKKDSLQIHTSLKSYLYTAVRNQSLDYLKLNKIYQLHKETLRNEIDLVEEDINEIKQIELEEKVTAAIKTLPKQNQLIFKLSRFEGKTNQEIADILNLSKRTVETHISNAIKRLKNLLMMTVFFTSFF